MTPAALYGRLLPEGVVDSALRAEAASFRHGRASMQIHVALSEPLGWRDPRLAKSWLWRAAQCNEIACYYRLGSQMTCHSHWEIESNCNK